MLYSNLFCQLGNVCCLSRISTKRGMFLKYAESLLRVPKSFLFLSLGVHIAPEWTKIGIVASRVWPI